MDAVAKFEATISAQVHRADGTVETIDVQQPTVEEAAKLAAHLRRMH